MQNITNRGQTAGFTLVELSIVVLIVGLLAAGVSVGKSMIEAAKLNSVINDYRTYKNAIYSFDSRYSALPGDFIGASSAWSSGCVVSTPTDCNGDNDGTVGSTTLEPLLLWKHLELAGMVPNSFILIDSSSPTYNLGDSFPTSKFSEAGYIARTFVINSPTKVSLHLAKPNFPGYEGKLSSTQIFSMDQKIDDGSIDSSGNYRGAWSGAIRISGSVSDPSYTGLADCLSGNTAGFMGAVTGSSSMAEAAQALESTYGRQVYYNTGTTSGCVVYFSI